VLDWSREHTVSSSWRWNWDLWWQLSP